MASLDKNTVRNEVSRLKDDFEQLCADGKLPDYWSSDQATEVLEFINEIRDAILRQY